MPTATGSAAPDPNAVAPAGADTRGPASGAAVDVVALDQASLDPLASVGVVGSIDPAASLLTSPAASSEPDPSLPPGTDPIEEGVKSHERNHRQ